MLRYKLNRNQVNTMKKKNIIYSAKNTIRNHKNASSVLKPETNSLSPSIRSKGTLQASQRNVMYNIKHIGNRKMFIWNTTLFW